LTPLGNVTARPKRELQNEDSEDCARNRPERLDLSRLDRSLNAQWNTHYLQRREIVGSFSHNEQLAS
jgi:hypothetical protein